MKEIKIDANNTNFGIVNCEVLSTVLLGMFLIMPDEFIHIYRVRLLNHVEVGIVILTLNNNGDI